MVIFLKKEEKRSRNSKDGVKREFRRGNMRSKTVPEPHVDAEKGHDTLRGRFKRSSFWAGGAPQSTLINQSTST